MLPHSMFFLRLKPRGKGLFRQMLYLQSQWIDFKNLDGVWKLNRFVQIAVHDLYISEF